MIIKFLKSIGKINLMIEPTIRHYVVYIRAFYFIKIAKKLKVLQSEDAVRETVAHNIKSIYGANNRMNLLIYPLSVIETLNRDSRILVIGPRNENDILSLVGMGFRKANIFGLDLISYTDQIVLGDMHSIPFSDAYFDAVVCGWTISYSTNPKQASQEMLRVTKPTGLIAVGVEYSEMTLEDEKSLLGYELQDFSKIGGRLNSTSDLKNLFGESVGLVYFEHDAPNRVSHTGHGLVDRVSNVGIIFSKAQSE